MAAVERGGMAQGRSLSTLRRLVSARQVFGRPVERKGVTVIPAAAVIGGGGGGEGPAGGASSGRIESGVGFGLIAFPTGAFEVRKDGVRWRAAIDNRTLLSWGLVALLLVVRRLLSSRD